MTADVRDAARATRGVFQRHLPPSGVEFASPRFRTIYLFVAASVVGYLARALRSVRASILRTHPALPEAARTLGRSSLGALRTSSPPLVAPGLPGGVALAFRATVTDLPATPPVRPAGFDALAIRGWTACSDGYFGCAVVSALDLLLVSGLSTCVPQEGYDVR